MKTKLVPGIFIPYILVDLSSSEFDAIENHVENLLANNKLRLQKFLENCGVIVQIRQNVQKKYLAAFTGFAVLGIIMLLASPHIYHFWIGNKVEISFILSTWVLIYNIVLMFGSIFVMIINGTGELKIQTYASLVSPIVFIGCSMLLIKYELGIESILIASIISNFNGLVLAPIQCHQILKNNE